MAERVNDVMLHFSKMSKDQLPKSLEPGIEEIFSKK